MSEALKVLRKEINELQAKQREILKQKEAADLVEFLRLDWIKEATGSLHISQFMASGINRYEISLYSAKIPDFEYNSYIPIYRSVAFSASGFNAFSMSSYPKQPRLATSNTNDLIDFLSTYRFKSLSFNEEDARLYNFLHNMER
jgi:hypothetical protein